MINPRAGNHYLISSPKHTNELLFKLAMTKFKLFSLYGTNVLILITLYSKPRISYNNALRFLKKLLTLDNVGTNVMFAKIIIVVCLLMSYGENMFVICYCLLVKRMGERGNVNSKALKSKRTLSTKCIRIRPTIDA